MAKGSFSGKPKKNHGFKPYDTTNSSFVRRITTRVSEILPQPTSWLTKWLSPAAPSQVETRHESEDEEDEIVYPSAKRPRLNSNNLHSQRPMPEELDVSPILSSRVDDRAVPGPSGLHLKKVTTSTSTESQNFVSSTPAITQIHRLPPPSSSANTDIKVNGDDVSESGESTSGCSSLVPQGERVGSDYPFNTPRPGPPATPKLSTSSNSLNTSASRSFHSRSKYPKLDLSSSSTSRERPSFDSFIFNNPHVTSVREDRSPFHRGRTMYGGAAGNRDSLCDTSMYTSPNHTITPQVINVRPVSSQQANQSRDAIGTSAMRILRALDHFSSPILDAKRIPLRSPNERLKRKAPTLQSYNELAIPQIPELLRIKRRQMEESKKGESSTATSSSSTMPTQQPPVSHGQTVSTKALPSAQPPPPKQTPLSHNKGGYSLREDDSKNTQRHIGSIKRKDKEDLESEETISVVNLPKVKLDLKTLPKININLPAQTPLSSKKSPAAVKKSPSKDAQLSKPSLTSPPKAAGGKVTQLKTEFKFSEPIIVSNAATESVTSVKASFSFSLPIDPTTTSAQPQPPKLESTFTKPALIMKKADPPKTELLHGRSVMEILGGSKESKIEEEKRTCSKCSSPLSSEKCVKCEEEKSKPTSNSLWSSLAKPVDKWNCKECFVSNNNNEDKCVACSTSRTSTPAPSKAPAAPDTLWLNASKKTDQWSCKECFSHNPSKEEKCLACTAPKPSATSTSKAPEVSNAVTSTTSSDKVSSLWGSFKQSDKWSCKECFVPNSNQDDKCIACSSPRNVPSSTTQTSSASVTTSTSFSGPPLMPLTQKKGWECSVCLVNNKSDAEECVACTTPKPGSKPKPKPAPTFSFGVPASEEKKAAPSFSFGVPPSENKVKSSGLFDFGKAADSSKPAQFSFGIPKEEKKDVKEEKVPEKTDSEENRSNSLGTVSFKAPEKSEPAPLTKTAPVFTFGSSETSKSALPTKLEGFESVKPEEKTTEEPIGFGQPGGVQDTTFKSLFSSKPSTFGKSESTDVSKSSLPSTSDSTFKKPLIFGGVEPSKSLFGGTQSEVGSSSSSLFSKDVKETDNFKKVTNEVPAPTFATPTPIFGAPKEQQKPVFQPISVPDSSSIGAFQPKPLSNSVNPAQESKSIFTFGSQPSTDKKVTNAFSAPAEKPSFFGNSVEKSAFGGQPSVFASNGVVNSVAAGQSFGFNNTSDAGKPTSSSIFGTFSTEQPQPSSNSSFNFNKGEVPAEKKLPGGGFNFNNSPAQPTFNFSAQPSTTPQISSSVAPPATFGSFNAAPFSTPQQSTGFVFGQPSQPAQQPTPTPLVFGQNQNTASAAPVANSNVFTFNATLSKPAAAPPTFDPNIKPNIKFTGGSIPTFSAMPMESGQEDPPRMIKKAIRRTKLNR